MFYSPLGCIRDSSASTANHCWSSLGFSECPESGPGPCLHDGCGERIRHTGAPRALSAMYADSGRPAAFHGGILRRTPIAVTVGAVERRHLFHCLTCHLP